VIALDPNILVYARRDETSHHARARGILKQLAARKGQNISRKGAKAAKFGQVTRNVSLRSWRLGAINFQTLRPAVNPNHLIFCPLTLTLSRPGRENLSAGSFKKRNILSD
jgi:hypothetical protein